MAVITCYIFRFAGKFFLRRLRIFVFTVQHLIKFHPSRIDLMMLTVAITASKDSVLLLDPRRSICLCQYSGSSCLVRRKLASREDTKFNCLCY